MPFCGVHPGPSGGGPCSREAVGSGSFKAACLGTHIPSFSPTPAPYMHTHTHIMIHMRSVQRCITLAQLLVEQNIPVISIHWGMPQKERCIKDGEDVLCPWEEEVTKRPFNIFLLSFLMTKVLSSIRDLRKSWRCALVTEGKRAMRV